MKDILRSLLHGSPGQGTRHHKLTGEFIGVLEGDGRKPFSTDGTFFFSDFVEGELTDIMESLCSSAYRSSITGFGVLAGCFE